MSIKRVVPNITSECVDQTREFYVSFLGFQVVMDMGWIITLASPNEPAAQISILQGKEPLRKLSNITLTIEVSEVELLHAQALARGIPIVYPLTTESWGVRRFHVTDPNGVVINVMSHLD